LKKSNSIRVFFLNIFESQSSFFFFFITTIVAEKFKHDGMRARHEKRKERQSRRNEYIEYESPTKIILKKLQSNKKLFIVTLVLSFIGFWMALFHAVVAYYDYKEAAEAAAKAAEKAKIETPEQRFARLQREEQELVRRVQAGEGNVQKNVTEHDFFMIGLVFFSFLDPF